jgi:hypothetical protein
VKPYKELAVLEQGEDGAIVSIRGIEGPLVLLGPEYLGHLAALVGAAEKAAGSLKPSSATESVSALCTEIRTLLNTYDVTCTRFFGDRSLPRTAAQIDQEIEDLRKQLDQF